MKNPNIGKNATDLVTGFTGFITGYCEYLTGCAQYCITPLSEDKSKLPKSEWFDENRISIDEVSLPLAVDTTEVQGAGEPAPRY